MTIHRLISLVFCAGAIFSFQVNPLGRTDTLGAPNHGGIPNNILPLDAPEEADETKSDAEKDEKDKKDEGLPLKPERTIAFPTEEGSWISVDVSPEGKTIVFDLLGDLYLLPFSGGLATNLTEGIAFDSQPRFSPDGKKVVFISDRDGGENLWTIELASKMTNQVTKGKTSKYVSPEWTPDGQYLVASKSDSVFGTAKLWIWHVDGGAGAALIKEPEGPAGSGSAARGLKTIGAAFGREGRYVWHAQRTGDWQYNAIFPQYEIAYYDRDTGKQYVRSFRYGSAFRPTLSPDGKWLVYGTRHEAQTGLRLRNLQNGEEKWLAYPVQRDDQESRATRDVLPGMSFTPDSREVVVSYGGKIWRVPVNGDPAIQIPFTVNVKLQAGPALDFKFPISDKPEFTVRQIRDAAPSPDGKRLAFAALDRLYVMNYPDGKRARLTQMEIVEAEPAWSPDGKWIAYATWSAEGGHLYKISSDGDGQPDRLTKTPAIYQQPAWSPDGTRIVALRGPARAYKESTGPFAPGAEEDLVWLPSDGGEARFIAPTDGRGRPHFTHDSERIYLSRSGGELVSIRWDGTDEKKYLKVTGSTMPGARQPMTASLVLMAPKGDQALAQVVNDLYTVTVPYLGGDTPTVSVANPEGAAFPVRRLTTVGGQFPVWAADGKTIHWSIGNAHFAYDLEAAKAAEEKAKAEERKKAEEKKAEAKKTEEKKTQETENKPGEGQDKKESQEKKEGQDKKEDKGKKDDKEKKDSPEKKDAPEKKEEKDKKEDKDKKGDKGGKEAEAKKDEPDKKYKDKKKKPAYEPLEVRIEIPARRDIPEGLAVLRGARVVTMAGDEVIEKADLVVRNNRIEAIRAEGQAAIPEGAKVIDVSGKTIIPGFVDTHSHMWLAWGIHKSEAWPYLANLAYGVTTTRDPQTGTTDVLTYSDLVEAGRILGPRIYSTGPGVFSSELVKDLDHARDILKRYSKYYDTQTIKMYMTGNRQQRQWIIMAAREQGLKPTTEGGLDLQYNLTMMLDGYPGQEHALPIVPLYKDVVRLVADTGITYTPTLIVSYGGPFGENYFFTRENPHDDPKLRRFTPHSELDESTRRRGQGVDPGPGGWFRKEEYVFEPIARIVKQVIDAGGRAGVGSHGQLQGLGYHWELWMLHSGGMTAHQTLRVATLLGAQGLGLDKDLGSLEAGKLADLIVLDANPLEDIRNSNRIRYVMKNGRLYEGDTLNEIWPREKKLEGLYWLSDEPNTRAGLK